MTWSIHEDTPMADAHDVLLAAIDALPDSLSWEDQQQARTAVSVVLTLLNVVGDPSVDPGVTINLEGEAPSHLSINVDQIVLPEPLAVNPNVPTDANAAPEIPDGAGMSIAGTVDEQKTGDAIIDNVPGAASAYLGIDASDLPGPVPEVSTPEPAPVLEPAPVDVPSDVPSDATSAPVVEPFPPWEPVPVPVEPVPVEPVPAETPVEAPVEPEPAPADVPPAPTEPAPVPVDIPPAAPSEPAPEPAPVDPVLGPITEPPV